MQEQQKSLIEDFVLVTGELSRIASTDNIDSALRLSSFLGCRGGITYLAKHYNLKTLFCAETSEKPSYYLTRRQLHQLDRTGVVKDAWNHVSFYKSDIRVEHIHSFDETKGYLESLRGGAARRVAVFTHEWAMLDDWEKVSNNFENVIAYCLGIVNK